MIRIPNLEFNLPNNDQKIILDKSIIKTVYKYRQLTKDSSEAGGQLFAHINNHEIILKVATIPDKSDNRTKYSFLPNRKKQLNEINYYFKKGLHFVGDWHTHPIQVPSPSDTDLKSMMDCFEKSKHELNYFILIIVGTSNNPKDIWFGLINRNDVITPKTN